MVVDQLSRVIASNFDQLDQIVDEAEAFFERYIDNEEEVYKIVLLTTEAVTNAIEHGNKLDGSKSVHLQYRVLKKYVEVVVEDEGSGFNRNRVENPLAADNLLSDGGRGLFLIEEMADEVTYTKGGRCVCIKFNRA